MSITEVKYRQFLGVLKTSGIDPNDMDQMLALRAEAKNRAFAMRVVGIGCIVVGVPALLIFIGLGLIPAGILLIWSERRRYKLVKAQMDHHWRVMQWPMETALT